MVLAKGLPLLPPPILAKIRDQACSQLCSYDVPTLAMIHVPVHDHAPAYPFSGCTASCLPCQLLSRPSNPPTCFRAYPLTCLSPYSRAHLFLQLRSCRRQFGRSPRVLVRAYTRTHTLYLLHAHSLSPSRPHAHTLSLPLTHTHSHTYPRLPTPQTRVSKPTCFFSPSSE